MQSENVFVSQTRQSKRRYPLVPGLLILVVWCEIALASWWLGEHLRSVTFVPYRAPAATLLLILGLIQGRLAWRSWRTRHLSVPINGARWRMFARWLSVGFVLCYGGSLLLAEPQSGQYLFVASLALWYTAVLLPLVGTPAQLARVLGMLERRSIRVCGWGMYVLFMTPLCAEIALRTYAEFLAGPAGASYLVARHKLTPGSHIGNQTVNSQGYWDEEFHQQPRSGVFRVAALGGPIVLGEDIERHFLSRIESGENVEVYNFALPEGKPADFAVQVKTEVAPYRPQLVLAFLSLGNDLTQERETSFFHWRYLHTLRWGADLLGRGQGEKLLAAAGGNSDVLTLAEDRYQAYLSQNLGQLMICRTPIDARMHDRWNRLFGDLERLIATCQDENLPLALVVTPSEFQVNPVLAQTLRRRAGFSEDDLDWELPQRRLLTFAKEANVTLIDLTPHLKQQDGVFVRNDRGFSADGHALTADIVGHFVQTHLTPTIAANE